MEKREMLDSLMEIQSSVNYAKNQLKNISGQYTDFEKGVSIGLVIAEVELIITKLNNLYKNVE